jgi:hypothetical protein
MRNIRPLSQRGVGGDFISQKQRIARQQGECPLHANNFRARKKEKNEVIVMFSEILMQYPLRKKRDMWYHHNQII